MLILVSSIYFMLGQVRSC